MRLGCLGFSLSGQISSVAVDYETAHMDMSMGFVIEFMEKNEQQPGWPTLDTW